MIHRFIRPLLAAGAVTDGPFNLAVACGQPGWEYAGIPFHLAVTCPTAVNVKTAVVRANGIISRGR
jgi:hypothetical protein